MQYTTVYIGELKRAIASRRRVSLGALEELVAIDSGSYDPAGVDRVGDALEAHWRAIGFSAERLPLPGFGDRRVFRKTFGGHGRVLILGHLDTVWPAGTAADWPYREEEGLAHGPGVGDMKGGLVMACEAVRALLETGFDGVGEIRHILVPDEELGSAASRAWIEAEAGAANAVLVLEPARASGAVVIGRGAVGAIIVRATGISAHTVNLAEGASALRALADMVAPLESLTDLGRGDIVNVGVLKGGDARQVVPPSAEMHIDLRARTGEAAERLLSRVMDILRTPPGPRVRIEIGGGITRPAFPRSASTALHASASRAANALGIDYPAVESGGGSDGSFAAALGRPTLDGLGPVCFDSCSRRERIVIDSLFDRAAILAALIADLPNLQLSTSTGARPWV
jgi:acetylornithine deacetylase/succinyl-diaminopimelate desuccinylase-like protein